MKKILAYLILSPFYIMHFIILAPFIVLNWAHKTIYGRELNIKL